ncbi:MAG: glycosyltransferase family 4 protein, partial [Armatimonadota bacterium]
MRIAIVSRQYPPDTGGGGVASYYATLAPALCQAGHDVTVITRGYPPRAYEEQSVHVIRIGAKRPVPGIARALRPLSLHHLLYLSAVDSALTDLRPDVVLTPESLADCGWYLARPRRSRAPVVVHLMSGVRMLSHLNPMPLRYFGGWALVPLEDWVVRRADSLTTLSRAMAEWTRATFRLGARPVEVIANPVDTVLFQPGPEAAGPQKILYVGRLEWGKGCGVLAQTIGRVVHEVPEVRMRFVGKDTPTAPGGVSMQRYMERLFSRDGVLPAVSFAGPRPRGELPDEYRSATVCVVPSHWETFGNVCLEA